MASDILKSLGDEINEVLGYNPTSNSTKPTYIANGVFRECTGETCDLNDIQQWILSDYKNEKKGVSTEEILENYSDKFVKGSSENLDKVKTFRYLLSQVFNPDSTVYPSMVDSAFNITSHWFIRQYARSEGKIGSFIFGILSKKIESEQSPALQLIRDALKQDKDDFTKLIKPILTNTESSSNPNRDLNPTSVSHDNIEWNSLKQVLREGFDRLANNIKRIGEDKNPLIVLERMVNFSVFSVFFYHINISTVKKSQSLIPMFIDSSCNCDSIKKASEQSYITAKKSVEDFYIQELKELLGNSIKNSKHACLEWIESNSFDSKVEISDEHRDAIKNYFESFCVENQSDYLLALARSLQFSLYTFTYKNNTPSDFCRVLGVRGGLVGPRGNRATVKRYILNSFALETITLSVLSTEQVKVGIDMKEFCKLLFDNYKIMFGADPESEYKLLEDINIAQSTPGDLRGDMTLNYSSLTDTYISLGLAMKYADGVTILKWRS